MTEGVRYAYAISFARRDNGDIRKAALIRTVSAELTEALEKLLSH